MTHIDITINTACFMNHISVSIDNAYFVSFGYGLCIATYIIDDDDTIMAARAYREIENLKNNPGVDIIRYEEKRRG